jgi:hypothetical protein
MHVPKSILSSMRKVCVPHFVSRMPQGLEERCSKADTLRIGKVSQSSTTGTEWGFPSPMLGARNTFRISRRLQSWFYLILVLMFALLPSISLASGQDASTTVPPSSDGPASTRPFTSAIPAESSTTSTLPPPPTSTLGGNTSIPPPTTLPFSDLQPSASNNPVVLSVLGGVAGIFIFAAGGWLFYRIRQAPTEEVATVGDEGNPQEVPLLEEDFCAGVREGPEDLLGIGCGDSQGPTLEGEVDENADSENGDTQDREECATSLKHGGKKRRKKTKQREAREEE